MSLDELVPDIKSLTDRLAEAATLIGAADDGSGEQASGICPSPASRPEVGSSPIQPAPGR